MSLIQDFSKGIWKENAVFKLLLGMCPVLAVTTSAENGLGMGLATTFVLVCSNIVVALLRKLIPSKVRIPAFIIVIATFVTVVQLSMEAWVYDLYQALGIFIPLIVVNCLILGRAEAFASKIRSSARFRRDRHGSRLHPGSVYSWWCPRNLRLRRHHGDRYLRCRLPADAADDPPSGCLHRPGPTAGWHEQVRGEPVVSDRSEIKNQKPGSLL